MNRTRYCETGALLAVLALGGCDDTPPTLAPTHRLLDHVDTVTQNRLEQGSFVTIDGVMRPVLTSSRAPIARLKCGDADASRMLECAVLERKKLPRTPWFIIEIPRRQRRQEEGREAPRENDSKLIMFHQLRKRRTSIRLFEPYRHAVRIRPVPPVERRDVVTGVLEVAPGTVLQAWFGIEEPAWGADTVPVAFMISVIRGDGSVEEVFRRVIDPARVESDRRWHLAEVPIPVNGEPEALRVRFATENAADTLGSSLPVWGDPTLLAPEVAPRRPHQIVLVSLDTLRARSMSVYGFGDSETTPYFEQLASEGTLFEQAFTTYSNTLASHVSMLTGLYPATHRRFGLRKVGSRPFVLLAERLREAGYETAAFTENALLDSRVFRHGFGTYYENKGIMPGAGDAEDTFRRALEWARSQADKPYFLFVHTYEVHAPYSSDEESAEELALSGVPTLQKVESLRRAYEKEIRRLDGMVAELVVALDELPRAGELLLVVTADHGEEFFEHGLLLHAQLFDEVMHIPMLMRLPGVIPEGLRVDSPVSLVDIVPTVLDLADVPATDVDGVSLLPLLGGKPLGRTTIFGQNPPPPIEGRHASVVGRTREAKCRLSLEDESAECFDLVQDSGEMTPLAPEDRDEFRQLYEDVRAYRAGLWAGGDGPAPDTRIRLSDETDSRRRKKLRALGYVE